MPAAAFRPAEHITRRSDFTRVYDGGVKVHGRLMTMFVHSASGECARLGIAATRKLGGAVIRNRAKRLTREVFRHHKPVSHVDVVVIPRREMLASPYVTVEREFTALVERCLLYTSPSPRDRTRSRMPSSA